MAPNLSDLHKRGPTWVWLWTRLFLEEQKGQVTAAVLEGPGLITQLFVQFTFGETEAWGIRGLFKTSFHL